MQWRLPHVAVAFVLGVGVGAMVAHQTLHGRAAAVLNANLPPDRFSIGSASRWEQEALLVARRELREILARGGYRSFRLTEVTFQGSEAAAGIVWWFRGYVDEQVLIGHLLHDTEADAWRVSYVAVDYEALAGYDEMHMPTPTIWYGDVDD